jgi:hypothetical protein
MQKYMWLLDITKEPNICPYAPGIKKIQLKHFVTVTNIVPLLERERE